MTKKDYRVLAAALAEAKPISPQTTDCEQSARVAWNVAVEFICWSLASYYSNFDANKFRQAAGYSW